MLPVYGTRRVQANESKPSFKSMASDKKVFRKAAPILFGDEFTNLATKRVDQLKVISMFSKLEQKKTNGFQILPLKILDRWLQGWKQKYLRSIPAILKDQQLHIKPKQLGTERVEKFHL